MAKVKIRGGDKWLDLIKGMNQKAKVKAGVLEGATNGKSENVALYAAKNEFGTSRIPSRPFMRSTLAEKKEEWKRGFANMMLNGRSTVEALNLVGRRMADDIQAKIMSNMAPPNSPATIARKNAREAGRAGTLVDTGALVKSINYEVES